jgi:hypothetical protein
MPDLILGPTQHSAPSQYTLAPRQAIIPESVTATFNGAGAAGAFLPTISIYSQDGILIARCPATSVAAGSSAEVTFAPLLRAATSASPGGSGWQYNIDNTGGWGLLETVGEPTLPTSQPSSFVPGDDPSIVSLAVNSDEGTVFTNNPAYGLPVVIIEAGVGATAAADGLDVKTDSSGGTGPTIGIHEDVNSASGAAQGIALGVSSTTGAITGVDSQADQSSGAAASATIAVSGVSTSQGAGDTIGLQGQSHAFGAGLACALRCLDHTGAPIFEVRDDGSVHILTATAIVADL